MPLATPPPLREAGVPASGYPESAEETCRWLPRKRRGLWPPAVPNVLFAPTHEKTSAFARAFYRLNRYIITAKTRY